jgi:RNA polymerase sigma-70 factor, ECF subfamily
MDCSPHTLAALRQSAPRLAASAAGHGYAGEFAASPAAARTCAADGHQALALAAQRGDRRAFTAIVELYQHKVYGFLRARVTEHADAQDLCQEVFLRCYAGREKLTQASAVGPWLIGIARNLLREHVRRVQQRREVAWTELCLELDAIASEQPGPFDDVLAHLPACLDSLGQSAREAIELRYRAQLRMAAIAEKLKRSEGAVKLLVHRARAALKHCLDRRLAPRP